MTIQNSVISRLTPCFRCIRTFAKSIIFSWPQVEEVAVKHPYQTSFQSSHLLRRAGKALPEVSFSFNQSGFYKVFQPSSDFPRGLRHAARTQHYSVGSSDQSSRQASSRAIFNSRLRTSNLSPSLRAPPRPAPARRQRLLNQVKISLSLNFTFSDIFFPGTSCPSAASDAEVTEQSEKS